MKLNNKHWSWILGTGLVLFVCHNPYQPLLQYAFLPWIGLGMILVSCMAIIDRQRAKLSLGDKQDWIPLVVIAASIALSGILQTIRGEAGINQAIAIICTAVMLFTIYPASRILGKDTFTPFTIAVIIESISVVIYSSTHNWISNGGLVSPTNYDIAAGLIIFGVLVSKESRQWWLMTIALVGLFFTGASEAIFILVVLATTWLVKEKTWSVKKLLPTITAIVLIIICITTGLASELWKVKVVDRVLAIQQATQTEDITERDELLTLATGQRVGNNWQISPILPFGHGYNMTKFDSKTQHNVILIIIEQVGILAALAWIWIAFRGIKRWRYVWIGFVAMGVFDHYIWTQAAPWFWCIAGVTSIWKNASNVIDQ